MPTFIQQGSCRRKQKIWQPGTLFSRQAAQLPYTLVNPAVYEIGLRAIEMRILTLSLLLLLLSGCSTGIVVHDQDRAAELVVDFLTGFKSDDGIKLSYEWTDDKYKEAVSPDQFARIVSTIRSKNQRAEIYLDGFEFFGPVEAFTVHARSKNSTGTIWFKFILAGSKTKDYYLLDLKTGSSAFAKEGVYGKYEPSILVQGV